MNVYIGFWLYKYSLPGGVKLINFKTIMVPMLGMIGFAYSVVFYMAVQFIKLLVFLIAKLFMLFVFIASWGFGRLLRKKVKNNKEEDDSLNGA